MLSKHSLDSLTVIQCSIQQNTHIILNDLLDPSHCQNKDKSVRQLCIQKYSTVVTHTILLLRCFMISQCALNKEGTNHSEEQRWRLPVKCNEQWRTFSWASTQVPHLFYASVQLKHDQIFNNGSSVSKISGIDPLTLNEFFNSQRAFLTLTTKAVLSISELKQKYFHLTLSRPCVLLGMTNRLHLKVFHTPLWPNTHIMLAYLKCTVYSSYQFSERRV